jgi:hypothetical protein
VDDRVLVIDDDLGKSASSAVGRAGESDWSRRSVSTMSALSWALRYHV